MAFWKKPSVGASNILRSRARRRERFADSISFVASRPASFRPMSASVTGMGRAPKLCQGELTEAKPERRDMREIPIIPTRSRHSSLIFWEISTDCPSSCFVSSHCPLHQKPSSHDVNATSCNIQAIRSLPFPGPVYSHPAAEIIVCISRSGIAMIKRIRRSVTVTRKANSRVVELMVLDISHRTSSMSTVARAIVAANVRADARLILDFDNDGVWELVCENWIPLVLVEVTPERRGKIF